MVGYLGIDVSKGYADFECLAEGGRSLGGKRFDDTAAGHGAAVEWLASIGAYGGSGRLVVGLESSGGLERNWLHRFKGLHGGGQVTVYLLNPLAVTRFLARDLHRNVTDRLSAVGIARYLMRGMRPVEVPYEAELEGPLTLYRSMRNGIARAADARNELQSLLPRVHPELVRYARNGLPTWLLTVLRRYPTATQLARAKPKTLASIPYVTPARAASLVEQAKASVAAARDGYTGEAIRLLATEILAAEQTTSRMKKHLLGRMADDAEVTIFASIPGIGAWTAVCLRLEIGPIERFHAAEALVAYAGLDPQVHASGDITKHRGISKRGRRQLRALLFPPTLAAIRCNPAIASFHRMLRERGKHKLVAIVACMRKLLTIAYACAISGVPFNSSLCSTDHASRHSRATATPSTIPLPVTAADITAPVTRREAQKRKKANALPQTAIQPSTRGLGVAFTKNPTPILTRRQRHGHSA